MSETAFLQQLKDELLQTLGFYRPGQPPVIYSPIQTKNKWSQATLAHEETHQQLIINTTYGMLFQMIAIAAKRGSLKDLLDICLYAQWGLQEGVATYVQMATIAIDDPEGLDGAISLLPSEELEEPPYREWFNRINHLLPLKPVVNSQEDLLKTFDQADFVVALGSYAMNSDVLVTFAKPKSIDQKSLRAFLARKGPDVRFTNMIVRLSQDKNLERLFADFRSLRDRERAELSFSKKPIELLTRKISSLDPDDIYIDNATRMKQSKEFVRAWSPKAKIIDASDEDLTASVNYDPDWIEKFPGAFPDKKLTLDIFRKQLSAVSKGESGLACSIAMFIERKLSLTTMPYPRGDKINPSSWEDILLLLNNPPTSIGVFRTNKILKILEDFPDTPLWVDFIRSSWRVWNRVAGGRDILRNTVQTCTEVELSEQGLRELLNFHDLYRTAEYIIFQVHGDQYAACFVDMSRPGIYTLQGVAGEAGRHIFERLVNRLQLQPFPGKFLDIPHAMLIRLAAQGLML